MSIGLVRKAALLPSMKGPIQAGSKNDRNQQKHKASSEAARQHSVPHYNSLASLAESSFIGAGWAAL